MRRCKRTAWQNVESVRVLRKKYLKNGTDSERLYELWEQPDETYDLYEHLSGYELRYMGNFPCLGPAAETILGYHESGNKFWGVK